MKGMLLLGTLLLAWNVLEVVALDALSQIQVLKALDNTPYSGRNFSMGTNPHLQDIFIGRCYAVLGASSSSPSPPSSPSSHPSPASLSPSSSVSLPFSSISSSPSKVHINNDQKDDQDPLAVCVELWKLFASAFRFKNDSDVLPSAFAPYFAHPVIQATLNPSANQALFWSGVSSMIPTYQAATGVFVMEVSSLIEIVSDLMYCGTPDDPSGYDYKSCIYGDFNSTGDSQWHGSWVSYWAAASLAYAPKVSGNITILLRGSPSPYRRNSFFGTCELPKLPVSEITGVQIYVVPEQGMPYDQCGEGSMNELVNDLTNIGLNASIIQCTNNPPLIQLIDCLSFPVSTQCLLS